MEGDEGEYREFYGALGGVHAHGMGMICLTCKEYNSELSPLVRLYTTHCHCERGVKHSETTREAIQLKMSRSSWIASDCSDTRSPRNDGMGG